MTTTTSTHHTVTARLPSRVYGLALLVAPFVFLIGAVVYISFEGPRINEGVVGGTISVWACFLMAVGFVGFGRLVEPVAPRGATLLTILGVVGYAAGAMFHAAFIHSGRFGRYTDYPNYITSRLFDAEFEGEDVGNFFGIFAYIPWGWMQPTAYALGGVLVLRTRLAPRWSGWALIGAGIAMIVGEPQQIAPIAIAGDVLAALGLVPVAIAVLAAARRDSA